MNDTDARLWHPWLRINRLLRAMLHTHRSAEAWSQVERDPARGMPEERRVAGEGGSRPGGSQDYGPPSGFL